VPGELKVGLVGLDNSHCVAFSQLLNKADDPNHVAGARACFGYPGGSSDFKLSYSRVEGFTKKLREEFGVEMFDSPEEVARRSDLLLMTAVDGRQHRGFYERIASFARPTFIDKPFTTSLADAEAILKAARQVGAPVMSCSALRYADEFQALLKGDGSWGEVIGCDVFGPMPEEEALPGLFWYGVHCIEMVVAAMGPGCRKVQVLKDDGFDLVSMQWDKQRSATFRGLRDAHGQFGLILHRRKGARFLDMTAIRRPYYAGLLEAILRSLPQGLSDVPVEQMLEVVRVIEAANQSRRTGREVAIPADS
jgi:predicted dehydrogenase